MPVWARESFGLTDAQVLRHGRGSRHALARARVFATAVALAWLRRRRVGERLVSTIAPRMMSATSSRAAIRVATRVAVRQGRMRTSECEKRSLHGPLVSPGLARVLPHPLPRQAQAVVERGLRRPAELALEQVRVEHRAADVAEPRRLEARGVRHAGYRSACLVQARSTVSLVARADVVRAAAASRPPRAAPPRCRSRRRSRASAGRRRR